MQFAVVSRTRPPCSCGPQLEDATATEDTENTENRAWQNRRENNCVLILG